MACNWSDSGGDLPGALSVAPLNTSRPCYLASDTITSDLLTSDELAEGGFSLPYTVCEVLVAVSAALGNTLVCVVFVTDRRLRKHTNYYILSLALSDLLVGLFGVPVAVLASVGLPKALQTCLFSISVLLILCTTSILNLLAVSVDRFWAILYPMQYARIMTGQLVTGIIVGCWVLGTVVGLLPVMGWNAGPYPFCLFTRVMDYNYLVFLYFATIVFPGLLMAFFYIRIYIVVVKQVRSMSFFSHLSEHSRQNSCHNACGGPIARKEVKAAKNLSVIVLFFMICWFPLYTINCVNAFCPDCAVPLQLTNFTIILSHANSALNPLLYAYNLKDFRRALYSLVCVRVLGCTAAEPADWFRAKVVAEQEALRLHRQRQMCLRTQSAPPRVTIGARPPPPSTEYELTLGAVRLAAETGRPTLAPPAATVAPPPPPRQPAFRQPTARRALRRARSTEDLWRAARSAACFSSVRQRPRSRLRFKSSDS